MAAGEEQSREYLRRHRLPELLHRLGALLLFHRPGAHRPGPAESAAAAAAAGLRGLRSPAEGPVPAGTLTSLQKGYASS